MYRFGQIYPLQDSIGLGLAMHSRLNLKYVGTGLGHYPIHTQKAQKKMTEWGKGHINYVVKQAIHTGQESVRSSLLNMGID